MPVSTDSSFSSCYGKSRNRTLSDSEENTKIFKTKVDILNCKPEDVKLKMEGNRVIIEGKLFKYNSTEKPVQFTKHYIMPDNCDLKAMRYTISPDGVYITAPKSDKKPCSNWPKLEEDCTTNCINLNDRFEIRLDVKEFKPEDIKIKVNGNEITIKARHLEETGMKRVIKTYSLPENCEITKLERKFTREGHLIVSVPKFLGLFCDPKAKHSKCFGNKTKDNVKCKFNITTEKFEIKIDVSSFKPEDINIIQQKRMVTVEGKSSRKCSEQKFEKTFVLPSDYDISKIDRKFHADGILVITVPRIEGKPVDNFKTFFPENSICDMQISENFVEIHLDISGYSPEEIMIKIVRKDTVTIEGKQIGEKGKISKSFMKSYLLPPECDTRKIKKQIHSNGTLVIRIPRNRKSSSLENLSNLSDHRAFSNGPKMGSVDNLSEPDNYPLMDSAELDQDKFEMKFNVQGFQTDDIYVKINKNIVTIECRHPNPKKGIVKSYLVPTVFDLDALHTYITHDDILIVTIPRYRQTSRKGHENGETMKPDDEGTKNLNSNFFTSEKIGDNYVIKVDIRGYNNNDISLDIKGQTVLVQGGHLGNRTISRSFSKQFSIPPNYHVEGLIYYISAGGFLVIEIPKKKTTDPITPTQKHALNDGKCYSENSQGFVQNKNPTISDNSVDVIGKMSSAVSSPNIPKIQTQTKKFNKGNGTVLIDENGNEMFRIQCDVTHCKEEELDVKIKSQNLKIEGKRKGTNTSVPSQDFIREFIVPDEFNMRGIKTYLKKGMLLLDIPKNLTENPSIQKDRPIKRDFLSNVKIGKNAIAVELDSSGLQADDFIITTNQNILTIELTKGNSKGLGSFITKVDLPEDSVIDEITKNITSDGKLLVTIPRIPPTLHHTKYTSNKPDNETEFIEQDSQKSCLVQTKPNNEHKSKSVKFLVDNLQSDNNGAPKFATLPRSVRSKSYNNVILENDFSDKLTSSTLDRDFELKILVPHHEPDEVIVKVRGSTVTIEGKKINDKGNTYFSKNFFKVYSVPKNIDVDQLRTTFVDRWLIITAPKRESNP